MNEKLKGTIKVLESSYGLIKLENAESNYFFTADDFKTIENAQINSEVTFEVFTNSFNKQKAINITLLNNDDQLRTTNTETSSISFEQSENSIFKNKAEFNLFLNYTNEIIGVFISEVETNEDLEYQNENLKSIESILIGLISNKNNINNINDLNTAIKNAENNINGIENINQFLNTISDISEILSNENISNKPYNFIIGGWNLGNLQEFQAGYESGFFRKSYIEKGLTEQITVYTNPPPCATWKIQKIVQKGFEFYIGKAPVNQIAQSSAVPALPPRLSISEVSDRITGISASNTEWQREMDNERILKIQNFINEKDNVIANAPMLYVHDDKSVVINEDEMIIHFYNFLKYQTKGTNNGFFVDRVKLSHLDEYNNAVYDDYRPLWIIDGQHRIRGIHQNSEMQKIEIPIIIFPKNFNPANTAKIFAEINTLQKKLDPLHELFMQYKFCIDHVNVKRKFRNYLDTTFKEAQEENWENDWLHSRANHLSYRIAAKLAKTDVLRDRIKFLPQNNESPKLIHVSADQWINYSRNIFLNKCYKYSAQDNSSYIYKPNEMERNELSEEDIFFTEFHHYFLAIRNTCNKNWELPRWTSGSQNKGLLQTKSHFIILLEIYSLVHRLTSQKKQSFDEFGVITINQFERTFEPLKNVDWLNTDLKNAYGGGGEKGRRSLEAWLIDAILHGGSYSEEDVMNSEGKSEPGRNILCDLKTPKIEYTINNSENTITEFKEITISSDTKIDLTAWRPPNARFESYWEIIDSNGKIIYSKRLAISKDQLGLPTKLSYNIKISVLQDVNFIDFYVLFKNFRTGYQTKLVRLKYSTK